MSMSVIVVVAVVVLVLTVAVRRLLMTPRAYPPVELDEIDRDALRLQGERLLEEAAAWPAELTDEGIVVATSLGQFPTRTVYYSVDVAVDFERAVDYVKDLCDCGETRRESEDKIEETLYDKDRGGVRHEWVRRSFHISPWPGWHRDAIVLYCQDRPEPDTYRVAFRSVDSIDGRPVPLYRENATRFMVNPAIFRVDETAPGRVRIRKLEAVDPRGSISPLLNNHVSSRFFFRKYMLDEARDMRDALAASPA